MSLPLSTVTRFSNAASSRNSAATGCIELQVAGARPPGRRSAGAAGPTSSGSRRSWSSSSRRVGRWRGRPAGRRTRRLRATPIRAPDASPECGDRRASLGPYRWPAPVGRHEGASGPTRRLRCSVDEGSHPLRRRRHPAPTDHPHEREAARAGGEQADPLLRHRGHGRSGDQGDRDHRGRHRQRDHGRGRRRLAVGRRRHLPPPGCAARARALRADRPRLPR